MKETLESSSIYGLALGMVYTIVKIITSLQYGYQDWGKLGLDFILLFLVGFVCRLVFKLLQVQTNFNKPIRVIISLFVGLIILAGGTFGVETINDIPLIPFQNHLKEYLRVGSFPSEALSRTLQSKPITGKIITVDVTQQFIDPLFLRLPNDLKAIQPEDVGTIVLLRRGRNLYDSYTDGSKAYISTCDVIVVDKTSGETIATNHFVGDEPVVSPYSGGSTQFIDGPGPDKQILSYLEDSLEHKP
jgi:hypothetical protein